MAIADIIRRGYGAAVRKVAVRGFAPAQPPSAPVARSLGSRPVHTSEGSIQ